MIINVPYILQAKDISKKFKEHLSKLRFYTNLPQEIYLIIPEQCIKNLKMLLFHKQRNLEMICNDILKKYNKLKKFIKIPHYLNIYFYAR